MAGKKNSSLPRLAVIGVGRMAWLYHLHALAELARRKKCVLESICDLNPASAAKAAKRFGAEYIHTDVDEMLDQRRPDGVVILTHVDATAEVASRVLGRGFAAIMEKPPGRNSRECARIIRAAREGGARNMVAFNRRFHPFIRQAKSAAAGYGRTLGASGEMHRSGRLDESFFTGTGIHALDCLRFLGGDIRSVTTDQRTLKPNVRPTFHLLIEYTSGGVGSLAVRPEAGAQVERYELYAENALVLVDAGTGAWIDSPGKATLYHRNAPQKLPSPLKEYRGFRANLRRAALGGFYQEHEAFVEGLVSGRAMGPTVEESLESVQIAEAVQGGKRWKRS